MGLFTPQNWNTFQCFRPSISRGLCFRVRWVVHPTKNRCFGIFGLKRSLWTGWNRCALKWWTVLLLGALKPLEMDKCFFLKQLWCTYFLLDVALRSRGKPKKHFGFIPYNVHLFTACFQIWSKFPFRQNFDVFFWGLKVLGASIWYINDPGMSGCFHESANHIVGKLLRYKTFGIASFPGIPFWV